ncbi:MAG: MATE family efflux transporter [Clostridia bacterium]|nr:MATE family efflux transporter [Clostridia bacterium]
MTEETRVMEQNDIETESAGEMRSLILSLTWPALAENMLSTLVSMADTIMIAVLGSYAISAVGLVTQPRFIVFSAFMALGIGSTAMIARAKGEGDPQKANQILRQSLILSAGIVLLLCVLMAAFTSPLVRLIAGSEISEQTIHEAIVYLRIQIYGFPLLGLTYTINAALRGAGNTRAAFYSNAAANIVNVFLNYCLIEGKLGFPALGVAGASIATVIGQGVAFVFCLYLILNGKQYIRLELREGFRPDIDIFRRINKIGMPALMEQVVMRVGMLLFTMIVTSLGDTPYAAHIIAMNIQSMSFTTGMAFGTAATTLTGQCLGRKRIDLAKEYVRRTQRLDYIVSVVISVLLIVCGGPLARLYTDEALIIAMVAQVLTIVSVSNPTSNARFVYNSALRGAGDSRYTAIITFIGILLVRPLVSAVLVYVFHMGLVGIWIALISDAVVCFVFARRRWFTESWATIRV